MARAALLLCALLVAAPASAAEPAWGADLSSWPAIAEQHPDFDPVSTWAEAGGTWIRVRLFHTSRHAHGRRDQARRLTARAREHGLKVVVALHLSDTWADPGRQEIPPAWRGLGPDALADSVSAYVGSITRDLGDRIDAVQIGNEIDAGILLPHGSFTAGGAVPLLRAAAAGVDPAVPIVLHFSGQDEGHVAAARVAALDAAGVRFDVVGLSWYPWWHGDHTALRRALDRVARTAVDRRLWVVESSYPFTLGWDDDVHNPVGAVEHVGAGPPATPDGQREWFGILAGVVGAHPATDTLFVWEPAWLAGDAPGSPWENLAWFDFDGTPLPAWNLLPGTAPGPTKE